MGILRTGFRAFSISPRNSIPAVAALLSKTNTSHIFHSTEEKIMSIIDGALVNLPVEHGITLHTMPTFEDLYPLSGVNANFEPEPLANINMSSPAVIYHSSGKYNQLVDRYLTCFQKKSDLYLFLGTTALPKPIYFTHRALARLIAFPCMYSFHLG